MRPLTIPDNIYEISHSWLSHKERVAFIKKNYARLRGHGTPEVTIVIPAYNEQDNILATLHSLCVNITKKSVQILVVNNNSTDKTEAIVKSTGIDCITEKKQGITAARNAGLRAAEGEYIMNADADAIYPKHWIDEMINPLKQSMAVALTYGRFSFLPIGNTGRSTYFFYEYMADVLRYINKYFKEEAVNVYGFNSAYRREEGLLVNGYNHPAGANEDGYLALKLSSNGFGKLYYVTNVKALVWTTDRRIQMEGGFAKGLLTRLKKYLYPGTFVQVRTDL